MSNGESLFAESLCAAKLGGAPIVGVCAEWKATMKGL